MPLRHKFASVFLVPAEQPGLGQRYQVLVPVQFPRDLVVANHCEIKKRNLEPRIERRALAVHRIEMPVNIFVVETVITEIVAAEIGTAAVKSEFKMFVAQQAKTMAANLIGLAQ